ncbi:hypothetical protein GQX73_g3546 [Xylaria multiplex]|uniref:Spo12-like protein n=1 Tax=Xylaria multiplex TaxID=323545 RepID=A0A7C8MWS7_9PEZI|nr:hypothetical protein GQX73_g3546 [Xylaria multiplex]
MGSANVLSEKDANNSLKSLAGTGTNKADIKSMEYHRQVLKSKMEEEKYGHTANPTNTTITISSSAVGASSGLGPTNVPAAVKPSLASSSQKLLHRALSGLPADPNASGACSAASQYISPSDNIMSPCTAKLNALKGRHAGKAKPKSLFAQASAKKFVGENALGARNAGQASSANANNANQQGQ